MPIGIGEDHEELRRTVRRWLEARCPPEVPRALLDAEVETMPPFWDELAGQGWLGHPRGRGVRRPGLRHARARRRGRGDGPGRDARAGRVPPCSPPPSCRPGADDAAAQGAARPHGRRHRPHRRGPAREPGPSTARAPGTARSTVHGEREPGARRHRWPRGSWPRSTGRTAHRVGVVRLDLDADGVTDHPAGQPGPHPPGGVGARRAASSWSPSASCPAVTSTTVRDLALVLAAAECAGGARWCLDVGTAYAIERRQFGRPIGQFQAIKHRLADMLVAVEQVTALAWDTAQAADAGDAAQAQLVGRAGRGLRPRRLRRVRQGLHPDPGGHGLHLGARRPSAPAPGPDAAPAGRGRAAPCGSRRRAPRCTAAGAGWRSSSPRTPSASGSRSGPWWPRWPPPRTRPSGAGAWSTPGSSRRTGRCRGDAARGPSSSS